MLVSFQIVSCVVQSICLRDGIPKEWDAIQRALHRLEQGAQGNFMWFNKNKYKVLHLGYGNSHYQHKLGNTAPVEKDTQVNVKLDMSQ